MNAASLKHSRIHNKVVVLFNKILPKLEWYVDLDYRKLTDQGQVLIRPDLTGIDPVTKETEFTVEISLSTLKDDMSLKRRIYEEFGVKNYVVFDCKNDKVFHFVLKDGQLVESEILPGVDAIFKPDWKG